MEATKQFYTFLLFPIKVIANFMGLIFFQKICQYDFVYLNPKLTAFQLNLYNYKK